MQHFYDGQIKRYLTQFMRLMSSFYVQDGSGNIKQVPVRYGDMSRQAAAIISKNSENIMQTAPFISCYIKDLKYDRSRVQDPTYVNKLNIREREFDAVGNEYLNIQGANYTIERLMPTPYAITFNADIWTTNTDQKFQLWEQITVLFNPSMELQTTDNYIDWTSLSVLELTENSVFESRAIPQGTNNDISVATLQFTAPIWITPPAKVKKLGIITKIISNVFAEPTGSGKSGAYEDAFFGADIFRDKTPSGRIVVTPGDFSLLVLNNMAALVPKDHSEVSDSWVNVEQVPANRPIWLNVLDLYPGGFRPGLSQLRLGKPGGNEIVAYMTLNPLNDAIMNLSVDIDTVPANTILTDRTNAYSRGTVDAIINPHTFNPNTLAGKNVDRRYLILEDIAINEGAYAPVAWSGYNGSNGYVGPSIAHANDIIQWDGYQWTVLFNSALTKSTTYITNAYTGIQYKWDGVKWSKSFEGIYENTNWRMIL
jgi:hypothetical protein